MRFILWGLSAQPLTHPSFLSIAPTYCNVPYSNKRRGLQQMRHEKQSGKVSSYTHWLQLLVLHP